MIDYYDTSITATATTAFTTDGVILDISESVILTPWEFGGPITVEAYINIISGFSFVEIVLTRPRRSDTHAVESKICVLPPYFLNEAMPSNI